MKLKILKTLSYLGLAMTLTPCFFVFAGVITADISKSIMLTGTILWFGCSVFWIKKDHVSL